MKKITTMSLLMICSLGMISAFAQDNSYRSTYYYNNSDYDIKIWEMSCYIEEDGKQNCTDEVYSGYIAAHQSTRAKNFKKIQRLKWQVQAGPHVTQAVIQNPLSGSDPKAKIIQFPICNDIQEFGIDGALTFDIDPETNKIICSDKIVPRS